MELRSSERYQPRVWVTAIAACFLSMTSAGAVDDAIDEELAQRVTFAEERGRLLFEKDRAAWVATDAMLENVDDPQAAGVSGWVTTPDGDGWRVDFIAQDADGPQAVFSVLTRDGDVVSTQSFLEPSGMSAVRSDVAAMFAARQVALAHIADACSPNINPIVVPVDEDEAEPGLYDVYLFPASSELDEIIVGGHHRVRVSLSGEIVERQKFSNSCLTLGGPESHRDDIAAVFFTHLLSPAPEEVHVFLNLSHRQPMMVLTISNRHIWSIENGDVEYVQSMDAE